MQVGDDVDLGDVLGPDSEFAKGPSGVKTTKKQPGLDGAAPGWVGRAQKISLLTGKLRDARAALAQLQQQQQFTGGASGVMNAPAVQALLSQLETQLLDTSLGAPALSQPSPWGGAAFEQSPAALASASTASRPSSTAAAGLRPSSASRSGSRPPSSATPKAYPPQSAASTSSVPPRVALLATVAALQSALQPSLSPSTSAMGMAPMTAMSQLSAAPSTTSDRLHDRHRAGIAQIEKDRQAEFERMHAENEASVREVTAARLKIEAIQARNKTVR